MAAWLWWAWLQIWPNLAASVLWAAPAAAYHHRAVLRRLDQHHQRLTQALDPTLSKESP